ncbi:hypothetical protein [Phyllobacterium zundukense]|uniref:TNase-like domain-containing protein n=1 Tax=Phyllobacterium zundukense TaxID=1867719 RepID=A0A2N9W010_9HYPH|nr:hypothetical protein [Phyllobacterium zundukense]ATU94447.1 hypothetical protein BLM14_22220 [Phyllobacterium zundukense]PIO45078.1 hypothetical protein B5P45_09775 [Phyllobacterium zundukense]
MWYLECDFVGNTLLSAENGKSSMRKMRSNFTTFFAMALAISGTAFAQDSTGRNSAAEKFVRYDTIAYSQGQDPISRTPSPIKFAECFVEDSDANIVSLSSYLVLAGKAFPARDGTEKPLIAINAWFEAKAKQAKSGIWSDTLFTHPYGERCRNNPINR